VRARTPNETGHGEQKRWKRLRLLSAGAVGTAGVAVAAVAALSAQTASGGSLRSVSGAPLEHGAASALARLSSAPGTTTTTLPPVPTVVAVSPAPGATGVALSSGVKVLLSSAPRHGAPMPALSPAITGRWHVSGTLLTFTPSGHFPPWQTETLTVPPALAQPAQVDRPRPSGPPATAFTPPAPSAKLSAFQSSFTAAGISVTRVQQLLAELHYLPLRFEPAGGAPGLAGEATTPGAVSTSARPGTFTWRFPNVPSSLSAQWVAGQYNVVMRGAVMAFESNNGLVVDGLVGPQVWSALAAAVAQREMGPAHYAYLMVNESLPERLVVWQNGADVYQAPANTGIPGATTSPGTYPVYERFQTTTMVGTDVDGTHYDVKDVPWVAYFNGGDAVHGYWRSAFGYPQSNGCVELPVPDAAVVWNMDPIGTLVDVTK
jgi:peptidoglycan hydrolase-like protein with peptidoglycan-binding domain